MPEKEPNQEVKGQENEETKGQENKENKETNNQEDGIAYTQVIGGEEVKLTEEQLHKVVFLGLQKAQEIHENRNKPKSTEQKKEEKKDPEKATSNEVAELKADMTRREIAQVNADVEEFFDEVIDIPDYFKGILKQQAFIAIATAKKNDEVYSAKKICKNLIKTHNEAIGNISKIDLQKKEDDKKKTQLSTKGKTAGQEAENKLTRKSFRDGSLSKRVAEHLEKLGE